MVSGERFKVWDMGRNSVLSYCGFPHSKRASTSTNLRRFQKLNHVGHGQKDLRENREQDPQESKNDLGTNARVPER